MIVSDIVWGMTWSEFRAQTETMLAELRTVDEVPIELFREAHKGCGLEEVPTGGIEVVGRQLGFSPDEDIFEAVVRLVSRCRKHGVRSATYESKPFRVR